MKNKRIAECFKLVKENLHKKYFICHTIDYLGFSFDESELLKNIIRGRLEGHFTVTAWLEYNHMIYLSEEDRLKYRLAWLDSMIEEFNTNPEGETNA